MLLQKTLVLRYCGAFDSPSLAKRFDGAATESEDKRLHEQILQPSKSLIANYAKDGRRQFCLTLKGAVDLRWPAVCCLLTHQMERRGVVCTGDALNFA